MFHSEDPFAPNQGLVWWWNEKFPGLIFGEAFASLIMACFHLGSAKVPLQFQGVELENKSFF